MEQEIIRKLVREQLEKALKFIKEDKPFKPELKAAEVKSRDEIIYNFEKGRSFGFNELQNKIENLEYYNLVDYLPLDENLEKWMFEHSTLYGSTLMVEIKHKTTSDKSLWVMIFASLEKGESHPTIENTTGTIAGYDNFIKTANEKLSAFINPKRS